MRAFDPRTYTTVRMQKRTRNKFKKAAELRGQMMGVFWDQLADEVLLNLLQLPPIIETPNGKRR